MSALLDSDPKGPNVQETQTLFSPAMSPKSNVEASPCTSSFAADTKLTPPPYTTYSSSRRLFIVLIVTVAGFFAPLCGAVYLPSLVLFQDIFKTSSGSINGTVSVYMAVFAVAPLFGAAASDYGGRKTVYICCFASFLVSNILLATVPANTGGLYVLRVFQALGSSMVTSVGAGTVADVTEPAQRASMLAIFLLGPQLGPILGPLVGGQFVGMDKWRWIFGFLAIAAFPVYLMILFFLPETLRARVGNGSAFVESAARKPAWCRWIVVPHFRQRSIVDKSKFPKPPRPSLQSFIQILRYLPNVIISINGGLQFGGLYCIYITFPLILQESYGYTGAQTGYAFLAPGIALFVASLAMGRTSDWMFSRHKIRHGGQAPPPEKRIPSQIVGFVLAAAGKLLWGWSTRYHIHAAVPLVGASVSAVGTGLVMITSTSYQTECMPRQAASLVALAGLMRNLASAISAAIIDSLVDGMGMGWCFTGLAIIDVLCLCGIVVVVFKGAQWRKALHKRESER